MGLTRVYLALLVVLGHSGFKDLFFVQGHFSVVLFFVISGFYMGLVLNEKYPPGATAQFFLARYLRLWPTFIVVFLLTVIFLRPVKDISSFAPSTQVLVWLSSLSIVGNHFLHMFAYHWGDQAVSAISNVHTSGGWVSLWRLPYFGHMWSIGVELIFYATAPFFARDVRRTIVVLMVAYVAHLFLVNTFEYSNPIRYRTTLAHLWQFSLGVLMYFLYCQVRKRGLSSWETWRYPLLLVAPACVAIDKWVSTVAGGPESIFSDALIAVFALSLVPIFHYTKRSHFDRFIGELSYPLYVVHWPIVTILFREYRFDPEKLPLLLASSLASAIILYFCIDRQVDKFRQRLVRPAPSSREPIKV